MSYIVPLEAIAPVIPLLDTVITPLGTVLTKLGLSGLTTVNNPSANTGVEPPPFDSMTEEEALALLDPYAGFDGVDIEPDPIEYTHDIVPTTLWDMGDTTVTLQLQALSEIEFELPGLDGTSIIINPEGFSATLFIAADHVQLSFTTAVGLRFSPTFIQPMRRVSDQGHVRFERDPERNYAQINLASMTITINQDGALSFDTGTGINLTDPISLGSSGVFVENASLDLNLSGAGPRPAGTPDGWKGVLLTTATVWLPDVFSGPITATDLGIGAGGVSGTIGVGPLPLTYDPTSHTFSGDLIGTVCGISGGLQELSLAFQQNVPAGGSIHAQLVLPFFETNMPLDIDVSIASDGALSAALRGNNGLLTLAKPGILELEVDSLGFRTVNGVFSVLVSGKLTPLVGGLDWPSFAVRELAIDADGNVHLDGGWLDLREQYTLDLYGFPLEITKLGFGTNKDGSRWIGCSGALSLVDGLSAGGSVEGLRLTWNDAGAVDLSLDGVGVEFAVPDVLSFKGFVALRTLSDGSRRFDGDIRLALEALELNLDAKLVVGTANGERYFAIHVGAELPAGLPLGATGLALYGVQGLFAQQMEPDKHSDEQWYDGWYKRGTPGVTDLANKWRFSPGSLAFGAGVTLGTAADNGYAFSSKMLLAIVFPGPIILLEGKANILRERAKLSQEPNFRALAVIDRRADTLQFALDARYKQDSSGKLIDIRGSAEAFFASPSQWHLALGHKEPRERRLRAELFKIITADAYFMLKPGELALGARAGYERSWKFGPLRVLLEAWIEGNARLSWQPIHFYGDLWLHGAAGLTVYGRGVSLSVDARLAADVFDPLHIVGEFSVGINLPWPLPDFDVDITLEWGPEKQVPPVPLPLKEVAIEHFKVTTKWPLPRGSFLLPNYDSNSDGFRNNPSGASEPGSLNSVPLVPLDARPHLTFSHPMHDPNKIGINAHPVRPEWERVGDPSKNQGPLQLKYTLHDVELAKRQGSAWSTVAKGSVPREGANGVRKLFGSWAAVPQMPDGGNGPHVAQVKLWLWSKTPFEYTNHTGSRWIDWFDTTFPGYPCLSLPADVVRACTFESLEPWMLLESPRAWMCPEHQIELRWFDCLPAAIAVPDPALRLYTLRDPEQEQGAPAETIISLPAPAKWVTLSFGQVRYAENYQIVAYNTAGEIVDGPMTYAAGTGSIDLKGADIAQVHVAFAFELKLHEIRAISGPSDQDGVELGEYVAQIQDALLHWQQEDAILEPYTVYQLKIITTVEAQGAAMLAGYSRLDTQTEYAYFRTGGPPALATYSTPLGHPGEFASGLESLRPYVQATIPPTLPAGGKQVAPRPVYRAYDVGVMFNENYVDLLYRINRRDLGLYLFDQNNRPVRDLQGRIITSAAQWGQAEQITLHEYEERWIETIGASGCIAFDPETIERDRTLTPVTGHVLEPDSFYEARLIPLLLHEHFDDLPTTSVTRNGWLGKWLVHDQSGALNGPSSWRVLSKPGNSFVVAQTTAIGGGSTDPADPAKPGTILLYVGPTNVDTPDIPQRWTDYRLSAQMRATTGSGAMGLAFRMTSSNDYFRFSLNQQEGTRSLVRSVAGVQTLLAQDQFTYTNNRDYVVTAEVIGQTIRIYQDGSLVFMIEDAGGSTAGKPGLYCWKNSGVEFANVRVDDLRPTAPVAYRFQFTSSRFANFFHQAQSSLEHPWVTHLAADEPADAALDAIKAASVAPGMPVAPAEQRAYAQLAASVFAAAAAQPPLACEAQRIDRGMALLALGLRTPEPIDWTRTTFAIAFSSEQTVATAVAGPIKLVSVDYASSDPNDEIVDLLVLEPTQLQGLRLEFRPRLIVTEADQLWQPYYTFDAATLYPAGTRVRVSSGATAFSAASSPTQATFNVAATTTSEQLHFSPYGVELRLVSAAGVVWHTRQFVPPAMFTPASAKLLRNADGTGMFVFPSPLGAGTYRLSLTYQRQLSGADVVLSEAGNTDPEVVIIDIAGSPQT